MNLEDPDLSLLAYQLELEIRSSFQSAYNRDFDCFVTLENDNGNWMIQEVNYN